LVPAGIFQLFSSLQNTRAAGSDKRKNVSGCVGLDFARANDSDYFAANFNKVDPAFSLLFRFSLPRATFARNVSSISACRFTGPFDVELSMFPVRLLLKMKHRFGYVTRGMRLSIKRTRGEEATESSVESRSGIVVVSFLSTPSCGTGSSRVIYSARDDGRIMRRIVAARRIARHLFRRLCSSRLGCFVPVVATLAELGARSIDDGTYDCATTSRYIHSQCRNIARAAHVLRACRNI